MNSPCEPKPFGYHENIPSEILEPFSWICLEISKLTGKWSLYHDFYRSQKGAEILHLVASDLFGLIRDSLINDILMTIGRLNDPKVSIKKEANISLQMLISYCNHIPTVNEKYIEFSKLCKVIEIYRNKFLAHNDLNHIFYPQKYPLPSTTEKHVDEIIKLLGEICNIIYGFYSSDYQLMIDPVLLVSGKDFIDYLGRLIDSEKELDQIKYHIPNNL